jgi:hypothetical protein
MGPSIARVEGRHSHFVQNGFEELEEKLPVK